MLGKEFAAQLVWQMQNAFATETYDVTVMGLHQHYSCVMLLWSHIRAPVNLNDGGYCFQMCGTG